MRGEGIGNKLVPRPTHRLRRGLSLISLAGYAVAKYVTPNWTKGERHGR